MTIDEAIKHCEEKAKRLRTEAEQMRNIGELLSNPKYPYNEPVKNCLECAKEHEQLAEWLKELKQLREQTAWIPVSERLPEEKTDSHTNDFEIVLCTTIWEDVRPYKFGKPIGHEKSHFWHIGEIMDEYVISWQPLPEPYKEEGEEE